MNNVFGRVAQANSFTLMRVILIPILAVLFIGYVIYRAFITKDIREHLNDIYFGLFFFGVWGLLYWWIFT